MEISVFIKKAIIILAILLFYIHSKVNAVGEASTYFEVFVPPNNETLGRDVCLIVTAMFDNTQFSIVDNDMDGDSDDSKEGVLNAGQSYILYIRENGINDDAPHSGEAASKHDGDYFIITSNNLILVSQSTNSDWQHDWVPATNKSSKGKKYIIYSPPASSSNRDLNTFAYEDNTEITVKKISWAKQTTSGYTNVDLTLNDIVLQQTLNVGDDIIFNSTGGRDLLAPGETYLVESNKDITVQYGALWVNARDGGGYVPSSNGSSSGELFYFAVPYQSAREQEIRIVAWDDNTQVTLDKFVNNNWINIQSWTLNALNTADWVSYTGNFNGVFRVTASSGKKVSVFEANWLETGSFGTSDIATMVSSREGNSAGTRFLVYMAPPGNEHNCNDPFTGTKMSQYSHAYLFSRKDANITVKDAYTNGADFYQTFSISGGNYADCKLNVDQWKSIYNNDGNPNSGPERPYLLIESDVPISVFNTNFNDNWMSYFGTSQKQDFKLENSSGTDYYAPNDTLILVNKIDFYSPTNITSASIEIVIQDGAEVIDSKLIDSTNNTSTDGIIFYNTENGQTTINYTNIDNLDASNQYSTITTLKLNINYNDGSQIPDQTVISSEVILSGYVDGVYQQATISDGITNNTSNQQKLLFNKLTNQSALVSDITNSWSVSIIDIDNDSDDDLLFSEYDNDKISKLYLNDGVGNFTASAALTGFVDKNVVVNACSDYNNDGNLDIISGTNLDKIDMVLRNNGNGSFSKINTPFGDKGYTHGIAFADVNNDGFIDMFISDYMPTRPNQLFLNNAGTGFEKDKNAVLNQANYSIGAAFADFDNDGDLDLFVPNDKMRPNYLYTNNGSGKFKLVETTPFLSDTANSTGCSWGDYDNDSDLDLFVTNAGNQQNYLYTNLGNGTFLKNTSTIFKNDKGNSHGSVWADFNNDGYLDLYITNDQNEVNFLYINDANGSFIKDSQQVVCSKNGNSFATAVGDLNNDGSIDLVVATHSNEPNHIYFNNANSNNWVKIKLNGTNSNKGAIGARVNLKANINGKSVWQIREVISNTGGGANAQSSLTCHFGLGSAQTIDSLVILWPSGYQQTLINQQANQTLLITEENGGLVSGTVFIDENQNCLFDNNEPVLANTKIQIDNGSDSRYFYTDKNGKYNAYLKPDDYFVTLVSDNWLVNCSDYIEQLITISTLGEINTNYNFPVNATEYKPDLAIDLSSTAYRKGFEKSTFISVKNAGTLSASSVQVSLQLNNHIVPKSASIPWDSISNQTIYWSLNNLSINSDTLITLTDSVNVNSTIGSLFNISAAVTSAETDLNNDDNMVLYSDIIVGAIDPNDLLVAPNKRVLPGDKLEYTIRFQNVGNYPASFVIIKNSIPENVSEGSFKMIASSHNYELTKDNNGNLQWYFKNINLVDSNRNEPESHGFIKYSVHIDRDLKESTIITNQAEITFDYNDPIFTNRTTTSIIFLPDNDTGILHIYPNPSTEFIYTIIKDGNTIIPIQKIELYNLSGKQIASKFMDSGIDERFNFDLIPGVYTIKATGINQQTYAQLLNVQ